MPSLAHQVCCTHSQAETARNLRWVHVVSGETSWEDPSEVSGSMWRILQDDEGQPYYYNTRSGQSQREPPDELAWYEVPAPVAGPSIHMPDGAM